MCIQNWLGKESGDTKLKCISNHIDTLMDRAQPSGDYTKLIADLPGHDRLRERLVMCCLGMPMCVRPLPPGCVDVRGWSDRIRVDKSRPLGEVLGLGKTSEVFQ